MIYTISKVNTMKQILRNFVFSLLYCACASTILATNITTEGAFLNKGETSITITALQAVRSGCIIECEYQYSGTNYPVTVIGDGSESISALGRTSCPTLTIRANATISANAFKDWTSLKALTMEGVTTPPALGENALPESLTKIVVPKGCAASYAAADGWKAWSSIIEDVNGQKATALDEVSRKSVIGVSGRSVTLAEPTRVTIYDMTGTKVHDGVATRISLRRSGIYVVKTDKETKRVAVK